MEFRKNGNYNHFSENFEFDISEISVTENMKQTFGDIFQCSIVNTNVTIQEIPFTPPMRILIISDSHLGSKKKFDEARGYFMQELCNVITLEKPTHIFHLGDLVDGHSECVDGKEALENALADLDTLKLPVFVIGGNHDRDFAPDCEWKDTANVHLIQKYVLRLEVSPASGHPKPVKFYFAHEIGNNYRVRDRLGVYFAQWIKSSYKDIFNPEDWFIMGHIHTSFIENESRVSCVGQFAPEIGALSYAILDIGENIFYDTKTLIK